ncbi:MAG: DNA polymerase III subunit gamma/tau [Thiomargarita sp.]|nr:DNA polymerase III subunit gamma/tau [Thiomargarita sp.]
MAYQVLARKWRPHKFSEMVGQDHVLRALTNALENNRLHHAYLFTGTRGVGKTTIARILAKSLNCQQGVTAHPCGECAICREVDEGRFVDLIEVDAASRTKVEDTRDLLNNVQYAPAKGRYKVYLIDEVHMLSTHSFNALLKTLEEPPSHVKFLLATTDPQKLPPTILSRCLQFNLKRLSIEQISQHLNKLAVAESIQYENQALRLLAKAADGSLRDALSLLDQAIAYGAGQLTEQDVSSMLGTLDQHLILDLVKKLAENNAASILGQIAVLAEQNPDFTTVLSDVLSLLQQIAIAQAVPTAVNKEHPETPAILELAKQLSPEDVQLFYQIGIVGRRDLPLAPDARSGFEMIMLRMLVFIPRQLQQSTPKSSISPIKPNINPIPEKPPATNNEHVTPVIDTSDTANETWETIVNSLNIKGLIKQLALNCELKKHEANNWHLSLSPHHKLLLTEDRKKQIEKSLEKQYGQAQNLYIRVANSEAETPAIRQQHIKETRQQYVVKAVDKDSFILHLKATCDAKINKVTVI